MSGPQRASCLGNRVPGSARAPGPRYGGRFTRGRHHLPPPFQSHVEPIASRLSHCRGSTFHPLPLLQRLPARLKARRGSEPEHGWNGHRCPVPVSDIPTQVPPVASVTVQVLDAALLADHVTCEALAGLAVRPSLSAKDAEAPDLRPKPALSRLRRALGGRKAGRPTRIDDRIAHGKSPPSACRRRPLVPLRPLAPAVARPQAGTMGRATMRR